MQLEGRERERERERGEREEEGQVAIAWAGDFACSFLRLLLQITTSGNGSDEIKSSKEERAKVPGKSPDGGLEC